MKQIKTHYSRLDGKLVRVLTETVDKIDQYEVPYLKEMRARVEEQKLIQMEDKDRELAEIDEMIAAAKRLGLV